MNWRQPRKFVYPVLAYLIVLFAFFFTGYEVTVYTYALFLFLPLLDPSWKVPRLTLPRNQILLTAIPVLFAVFLLLINSAYAEYFVNMLVFTAIPEEWFFRAYLLSRVGFHFTGNLTVSIAFAVLHGFTQSLSMIFLVFFPSLIFGYIYQATRNIYLVAVVHALSNLVFIIYIKKYLDGVIG